MSEKEGHIYGDLESIKFDHRRKGYNEYIEFLKKKEVPLEDFLHDFTAYVGHMSLNRLFTIYELYKKTLGLAGHIADIGVYKGASSLLFAKLIKNFESEALTLCHGFDWFEGIKIGEKDSKLVLDGGYKTKYEDVLKLIEAQGFSNILKIHKLNLMKDLPDFFDKNKHLRFKLVMMDAGTYEVMDESIPFFYDRLITGGIMIFDQYSHEFAPGESLMLHKHIPSAKVRTIPNSWMPNAYIIKE